MNEWVDKERNENEISIKFLNNIDNNNNDKDWILSILIIRVFQDNFLRWNFLGTQLPFLSLFSSLFLFNKRLYAIKCRTFMMNDLATFRLMRIVHGILRE